MKPFFFLFLLLTAGACMPEEDLPIRDMGKTPDYFIECYCKPGEIFALTATSILPVSEELKINFTKQMTVNIFAKENIELFHARYTLPGSDFVYNYGSHKQLEALVDTLYLNITTNNGEKITAKTIVPEQVMISSHQIGEDHVSIRFYTSEEAAQNYYIFSIQLMKDNAIIEKKACYLDYSRSGTRSTMEKDLGCDKIGEADQVILNLKRITEANYEYQISLNGANSANQSSITTPVPLKGNLNGAIGIFTCYTEDSNVVEIQ